MEKKEPFVDGISKTDDLPIDELDSFDGEEQIAMAALWRESLPLAEKENVMTQISEQFNLQVKLLISL